ncbi:hypothetical protein CFC21_056759 [Triticum aestivum]|uniref:Uncharacterized protein n=3 Tax=Triticum TaxID=4564 RepID=A0A9R0SWA4_TRITD|nr:hypothetical protein CFC21_056759 [Triticum aestivum]VAI02573.1 unnamed protein product [Triticum turgidum subsp. durum]
MTNFGGVRHAVDYVYDFIALSSDEELLDTIWIRSPRPFHIEISLQIIRDTILGDGLVHPLCFNLAVRKITTDAAERSAGTNSVGKTHFFNLGFHVQARALRQTWLSQEQRTNALINNVVLEPFPRYCVFHTPTIDPHGTELQREALLVKQELSSVLQQEAPDRNSQLVEWPEQDNIHVSPRRMDSGFKVLQEMAHLYETIGNDMVHNMTRTDDPQSLRKRLMVQLLMVRDNQAKDNIPEQVRAALRFIGG